MLASNELRFTRKIILVFVTAVATVLSIRDPPSKNEALREACASGLESAVAGLLNSGADPHAANDDSENDVGETPLHLACISGNAKVVSLLLKAGADPNRRAHGPRSLRMSPLTWCAYGGFDEAVEALLEGGADPNLQVDDEKGNIITALDIAVRVGDSVNGRDVNTVAILKRHNAKHFTELQSLSDL